MWGEEKDIRIKKSWSDLKIVGVVNYD